MPLASSSVNLAGQPSKVGGTVARVFGWLILAGGWVVGGLLAGLLLLLDAGWTPALVIGGPIALVASIVAWALLRSGKQLQKSGDDAEVATKNQAIFALANTRGGVLTAWDVAQMLQVTPKEGDDILTKLAKEHPDYVTVDVDDNGTILYRVIAAAWRNIPGVSSGAPGMPPPTTGPATPYGGSMAPNAPAGQVRVGAPPPRSRVDDAGAVRVDPRDPIDDELETAEPLRQKAR